jgi:predicted methyltransferase
VPYPIVFSHFQAEQLLHARRSGQARATTTSDLGLTQVEVTLAEGQVMFPDGTMIAWAQLLEMADAKNACFVWQAGEFEKIQRFSTVTNRFCSLMPTEGAPTLLIAGFPMHRIKDTDPYRDTLSKIKCIRPVKGRVLDTTTGLGYTAIEASREAGEVTTIELDPAVLEIARFNPWSRGLFENPNIRQVTGDSREVVEDLPDNHFSRIVHDPPTRSLAGELYSTAMYRQLFRVLVRGGRLFHYTGNLESGLGSSVVKGVIQRLKEAGFPQIRPAPQAFGVVAYK